MHDTCIWYYKYTAIKKVISLSPQLRVFLFLWKKYQNADWSKADRWSTMESMKTTSKQDTVQPYLRLVHIRVVFPRKAFERNEFHFIPVLVYWEKIPAWELKY